MARLRVQKPQKSPKHGATSVPLSGRQVNPVNILLRFSSGFPWPANLIHHFTLIPNPKCDLSLPLTSHDSSNFLYQVQGGGAAGPVLIQTISAPVRLFSFTDMAIGRYGTAIWIDTEADSYFGSGMHGQRIAGCPILLEMEHVEDGNEMYLYDNVTRTSLGASDFRQCSGDEWTKIALDEENAMVVVGGKSGDVLVLEYL